MRFSQRLFTSCGFVDHHLFVDDHFDRLVDGTRFVLRRIGLGRVEGKQGEMYERRRSMASQNRGELATSVMIFSTPNGAN